MSDLISRKAVLKHIEKIRQVAQMMDEKIRQGAQMMDDIRRASIIMNGMDLCEEAVRNQPSAQSEIIRCNACRHWHQTVGKMEGFGLGDCDYLEKKLVTCNGYCYWAERRTDE
jgi:hypothetical protein